MVGDEEDLEAELERELAALGDEWSDQDLQGLLPPSKDLTGSGTETILKSSSKAA